MQKTIIKLNAPTILQIPAGEHDAIVADGQLYVPLISAGLPTAVETAKKPEPKAEAPKKEVKEEVAEAPKASSKRSAAKAEPKAEAKKDEPIDPSEYENLEVGSNVQVILSLPEFKGKVWAAEVVSYDEENGLKVKFHEDGDADFVRPDEGDKVFPFGLDI